MEYVIRATWDGHACWITGPRLDGHRTFGARRLADRFTTEESAAGAIDVMRSSEDCYAIVFSVETADQLAGMPSF
jgi:hypothetical protein